MQGNKYNNKEALFLKKGLHQIEEEESAKKVIDSDLEWDLEDTKEEERKKLEYKKLIQDKKGVREYETSKAQGTLKHAVDEHTEGDGKFMMNEKLDGLWRRIRYFFDDLNDKGERKENAGRTVGNRIKFTNACRDLDMLDRGILSKYMVERAFNTARFVPALNSLEYDQVFKALEVYQDDDVNYRKLLEAPIKRETTSVNGIFPIIKAKGPTQKQIEDQRRREEDEKRKKEAQDKEEKKKKEQAEKRIEEMKKQGPQAYKKPTREEQKMKEREEFLKKEEDQKLREQEFKEETEMVKREVFLFKQAIEYVQKTIKSSGEHIRNWFKLVDKDGDNQLDIDEIKDLFSKARISMRSHELEKVFDLMDSNQNGKISYNEFCNVVEDNKLPSIEDIVRKRRMEQKEKGLIGGNSNQGQNLKTVFADNGSYSKGEALREIGSLDGMSSIMQNDQLDKLGNVGKFIDDDDVLRVYNELKELLMTHCISFDDVLLKMGQPKFQQESKVSLADFEKLIKALPGSQKYSVQQIKQVFHNFSSKGKSLSDSFISLVDFKDRFYPGIHYERQEKNQNEVQSRGPSRMSQASSSKNESKSESMHVDAILAGKKFDEINNQKKVTNLGLTDIEKEKDIERNRLIKEKELKYQSQTQGNLHLIREDRFELNSQSSAPSQGIDDIVQSRYFDPRKKTQVSMDPMSKLLQQEEEEQMKYKVNKEFFRQNEVIIKQMPLEEKFLFDRSLDMYFKKFCKALLDEISSGPVKRDPRSYVEHYGKEYRGFLTFQEFKEIHAIHVSSRDDMKVASQSHQHQQVDPKLRALFSLFDANSSGRISEKEFVTTLLSQKPSSSLLERMSFKVKKGGDRMVRVLEEEFQEADIPYGCNGSLPIANFQTIMIDYDLHVLESDLQELRKKGIVIKDKDHNEFVRYNMVIDEVKPKKITTDMDVMQRVITKIQANWRGHIQRKKMYAMASNEMKTALDQMNKYKKRRVSFKAGEFEMKEVGKNNQQVGKKKQTLEQKREEAEKKKKSQISQAKAKRKKTESLEARMGQVIKIPKDNKLNSRQLQQRKEISEYIKTSLLDEIVNQSIAFGESLLIGRDIQQNFEKRPVTKYVFPLIQEFQYNVMGVQPKSLQSLNELGQIMFLDSESSLSQYDIPSGKTLQPTNLGTRPPLKHYDIIDMICDQTSSRIYTLNSNWILEIWNIEQNVSLPQKRLAVCTNEGNKDYISLYYKNTFNHSKPKFLSLSDHNQQILVANTSCVDGSIVFIDPISFSVLKKIQLRYQDYEIPKKVKDSINNLKAVLSNIVQQKNKTIIDIFSSITNKNSENIQIRDFVLKLTQLDPILKADDLFVMCQSLDENNDGQISLDEFLQYFQHLDQDQSDFEKLKAEEELSDKIWPEWILKEGHLEHAKNLLGMMFDTLEKKHGISAESAFGIYDSKDRGLTSIDEFKRILRIFFGDVLIQQKDIDFIMKMTQKTVDQQVMYREFSKYLNKRFIRTFRNANTSIASINQSDFNQGLKELDQVLKKEASLNYAIRKAAELNLDLRTIFIKNDESELSVIPRMKFWRILENLPLGLQSHELDEIFDNDLHYDNSGNVDYTVIINSDMFVMLERQRLRKLIKKQQLQAKRNGADETLDLSKDTLISNINNNMEKFTDNRKVVVEDLIYIDDLEILIYTTIAPKTSSIFITHTKKAVKHLEGEAVEIVNLSNIKDRHKKNNGEPPNPQNNSNNELMHNYYQLLARLRGHRNTEPPTLLYIPFSGCLISGEKHVKEVPYQSKNESFYKASDPTVPVSHQFAKSNETIYEKHASREERGQFKSEILIWNIQRDLVELFQTSPPWNMPIFKRFQGHNASIIDICYLQKAQLLVTTSTDQTIRFFDPVSSSFSLTDPNNIPHSQQRPGYYKPLINEDTSSNATFKEVKRIYTGVDTSCFTLRTLNIQNIHLDPHNNEQNSQIEWLIGLKLGKPSYQGRKNTQSGFICGYGIERVKIEVPAIHVDDIVPPYVMKECEDLVQVRRKRLITAFQQQLPHQIERIYSQVSLQSSYISQIRKLFLEAILNRKDLKYVNSDPLRQIYNIILKLPNRNKFQNFLATSGCSDKLSVSETFFYLQKLTQIHPLRTTQIEFEKSIEEFQRKHQREFLRGVKRWPKKSIQKFADYIRMNGLEMSFLKNDKYTDNQQKQNDFCTRERFIQYFNEVVFNEQRFSDDEIYTILNELDPFFTGIIQIHLIQSYYKEEIHYYNMTKLNRPKQIFDEIRSKVFPNKKLAIQKALTAVDVQGDGYIQVEQFVEAFQKADVVVDRQMLEFLFDVVAEKFNTLKDKNSSTNDDIKNLQITYFINKLFSENETNELQDVQQTLQHLKASLVYKGLDYSIIFAENTVENVKNKRGNKPNLDDTKELIQKAKDQPIDLTMHYTRFAQQLVKEEFCQRLQQLKADRVSDDQIQRLANFLCLNQKNNLIVYLNAWLHQLQRVSASFQVPDKNILPMICSKLLRNENVLRSYIESIADLKGRRETEKIIDVPDLRQVLSKFGVNYLNQAIFLNEFNKNDRIHVEDLLARMKNCLQQSYNIALSQLNQSFDSKDNQQTESETIKDLVKTDYFEKVQQKLRSHSGKISFTELVEKCRAFDPAEQGKIKVYHFINILKHNYKHIFEPSVLIGLQFELEAMNSDNCVDYEEFVKIFIEKQNLRDRDEIQEVKLDKRSAYQIADYEDLLSRISTHVKSQGLDLLRVFKIYSNPQGTISYEQFQKILTLIEFNFTDTEFKLLIHFADENGDGVISAYEFSHQIVNVKEIGPSFDLNKWIVASRVLDGRYKLLEKIQSKLRLLKDALLSDYGEGGHHSGVTTGEQFQNILRDCQMGLSEYDIDLIANYAIKGSRRQQVAEKAINQMSYKHELIQFKNFEKSLIPVINSMRQEHDNKKNLDQEEDVFQNEISKFKQELEIRQRQWDELNKKKDPREVSRELQLKNKIMEIFQERDITFFDCFQSLYDPLNSVKSMITITQFKKSVNSLNLPLTVQEHRILRRIADPQQIGKVDIKSFCIKFENEILRKRRLNAILEKVATAFFLQNFNLRRAFSLFDKDGDGTISTREFRQGWLALDLGLTYDEIDDLQKMVDTDKNGSISYDEFISVMDIHIKKKGLYAANQAKDVIFLRIKSLLEYNKDSLVEIMYLYDIDNTGFILKQDLVRSFQKLGIQHPHPHLPALISAGGYRESDEKIDYVIFCQNLVRTIESTLGLKITKSQEIIQKVFQLIKNNNLTIFDLFCTLDVNLGGRLSKVEFKTGIQNLGLTINNSDFEILWKFIKKPVKKLNIKDGSSSQRLNTQESEQSIRSQRKKGKDLEQPDIEELSYYDLLMGFVNGGCLKLQKSVDNTNNIVNKFRQQMKKKNISVEKAYKQFDPDDRKFVFRHDFINECFMLGFEFTEEEFDSVFEYICQVGTQGTDSNNQQVQQIERKVKKATTRFTFKQFHDAILVKRDENWLFQSYIKIHGIVLQKNLTYKRLFNQWREKNTKTVAGRLSSKELKAGLKKLRAGLTQDEIEKLISSIQFEGKDNSISSQDFERLVVSGARRLEQEKTFEKLLIQEWISTFNQGIVKNDFPIDSIFQEHDTQQKGSLNFEEFVLMNQFVGLATNKKDLKRTFDIIDKNKKGKIRLEEIKNVQSLIFNEEEGQNNQSNDNELNESVQQSQLQQELDDLYESIKEKLEKKNITLENQIYDQLKYMPNQFANIKALQQVFERLQLIISKNEVEKILNDVRSSLNGKYECSFKDFIDFMTKKRINVAFLDKGFVDPLIAQCCQNISKAISHYEIAVEKLFNIYDKDIKGYLDKNTFMKCIQGMELGIAIEDIIEFFNYLDEKNENIVTKLQFIDGITFIMSKIGGGSKLDQALNSGIQTNKKGFSIRQKVFEVMKRLTEAIQHKNFQMRQIISIFDLNNTGFLSRAEFMQVVKQLEGGINIEEARMILSYFDDKNTGKISVIEFVKAMQDIMNNQTGGNVYHYIQVNPIIQKIINQLAINSDKFFDELAELNERLIDQEVKEINYLSSIATRMKKETKGQISGLSKRLFFQHLGRYGVNIDEDEKTLFNTVFGIQDAPDKFDYDKIDTIFEGVQQQLYAQEQFYTVEWERRIFKKIGEYLRKNNLTIHQCFNLIDEDNSQTISIDELRNAIIRFQIGISDNEIKKFLEKVDEQGKGFITLNQFIKRFWAAYTYENVFGEINTNFDKTTKSGGLSDKMNRYKMFHSIQARLKLQQDINQVFKTLDSGIGFLILKDFSEGLNKGFGITLKRDEVIKLFKEIDTDKDGLVKYKEFETFMNKNYDKALQLVEKEQQQVNIQYEIFDHLMKVLHQKSLTLAEVFQQIDDNKNGYIEVDEFQNLLERLGFTISEAQVFELMRQMDENFDGRISYNELKIHIKNLGFSMNKEITGEGGPNQLQETFVWRDKGIEVLIRALNKHLNHKSLETFFDKFDADHDQHLTPSQFRQSLLSLGDSQVKKFQIERILHLLVDEKKSMPLISINRLANFFKNYQYNENDGNQKTSLLIDEDLFVYIVEKYDGFSRMVEQITVLDDKTSYLQRHVFELNLRGLNMMSNQKTVEKLHKKTIKLNDLFQSTLILLAGEANRIMKDEAQLCVLDPTYNINTIVNDQNIGVLNSIQVPIIENSAFDIDFSTLEQMPSGAQRYIGIMPDNRKKVEILIYPNDDLNYVSQDGKTLKKHLQLELQVQRFLMGAQFDEEIEMDSTHMDVFLNYGRFEKKIGLSVNDKEIYVVNELVDKDEWISLDEFVVNNGGILNIPLFYHTDAPLFIIRHWAKKILQIIEKVHNISAVFRSLNLKQVFISRDGQRVKLGHFRGVGKVNNLGNIGTCPDIYLSLENNSNEDKYGDSSTFKAGSSSKKTETQKTFSNRALDNPFLAPELLFSKFSDHTSALDVWSFGMLMYCILVGQEPDSFYSIYRGWYKKQHGHDIEMASLPFIPPSQSNFLYDPFSIDFDNPFKTEELAINQGLNISGSLLEKTGTLNFENFMKCIKNLSHSSLFQDGNSKKFQLKSIAQSIKDNNNPNMVKDRPPEFAGQSHSNDELRKKMFQSFAKASVLERKNELGLILDIISSCLDMDPKRRPTIAGLLNSPLFSLDKYEKTNAIRFSENVILYRSPQSSVSLRIANPLRQMCAIAINTPDQLLEIEADIVKMFVLTQECLQHISTLPLDSINAVLTEDEKRRGLMQTNSVKQFQGKDYKTLRISPNSPLATQIIEDKIIDMLIFLTLRYFKTFNSWKQNRLELINKETQSILKHQKSQTSQSSKRKSVKFQDTDRLSSYQTLNQQQQEKKQTERLQNTILQRMCDLLRILVYEMHSYSTPMAPFVKEVIEYIVKFYVGEEYQLGSDQVLRLTSGMDSSLKDYLLNRSFFRRDQDLTSKFKTDRTDKLWHTEQKNKSFLDKSNYWNTTLHKEALRIYKDAITESGLGQSCYPVINDYISNINNSFEPSKVFSRQMNQICISFLIPMSRTSKYYDELIPLTDCLSRLESDSLEKAGKRCLLAVIRSIFQTGTSDKIKACLDIRVPKHIIHFLQDHDSDVRHETLLIFLEISKGLQDEDYEIIGKNAAQIKREFSKRSYERTAFDQHKSLSMMSQQQDVSKKDDIHDENQTDTPSTLKNKSKRGKTQQSQADMMSNLIKRTTALIEKNENDKYINFAMDLPNLNFLANKRFLKEMSICFESPVFIAPLIRLLKNPIESFQNKEIIVELLANLFCGNEKVLIAINSPACDTYMTLLKMLMSNSKIQQAQQNLSSISASTRNQLALQGKVVELFKYIFEQRRPTIIRDFSCIGAAATLLKEQGLTIPNLINLPEIIAFVDEFSQLANLQASMIIIEDFTAMISDLRCWIKHFYSESQIPELTRIKAVQRSINLIIKVVNLIWSDFPHAEEKKGDYLILIKACISLMDWLCVRNQEKFIFNEQSGKYNLDFIIDKCTFALSAFRHPQYKASVPTVDLTHNSKANKEIQKTRKYDMFPFTEIGAILQNILYQLIRKNDPFLNQLLSEADYGFMFGEQLILEYDFIKHCIDNKIESMVLIDTYVKKNEIRLNTYEYLLSSNEQTLKYQFIKSNFIDKMFNEYIYDFREFNIQFSKIDLEFLAFRKTFPIRLEAISILNTSLVLKDKSPGVYTELIMYAKRYFLIKNEVNLLRKGKMSNEESTSLLLFSIILESNDEDLVYAMMQEGAHKVIRDMIKEFPSLSKRFPILNTFTNKF